MADLYQASGGGYFEEGDEGPTELTHEEYVQAKAAYEAVVQVGEAAVRLAENPDFKLVFMERYFKDEPTRLGMLIASGTLHPTSQEGAVKELESIGRSRTFMSGLIQQLNIAKDELAGLEEAYNESVEVAAEGEVQH